VATYGGIEGGGTKFVCAVGSGPDDIRSLISFDTADPAGTIGRAIAYLREQELHLGRLDAIGIGMFGPLDLRPESATFGHVLRTPKLGWSGADVLGPFRAAFPVPAVLDTDVNAATLAEWRWGAAQRCDPALYVTVGTGIGGGAVVGARPLHGLLHAEMGHVPVRRHPEDPPNFVGTCPFHGDCLEGLASGPAIERRWGVPAERLPAEHVAWDVEAFYLAQALTTYIYTLAPERIVLGGGVMRRPGLLPRVRDEARTLLGGYLESDLVGEEIDRYIVSPGLGDRAGVLGALALAATAGS
jgi:fructokinase